MKRTVKVILFSMLTALSANTFAATNTTKPTTIGIVVPIELPAMTQIVDGLETTLKKESKTPVQFLVKNALGNPNIQRSILQEFNTPSVDIVAPIGTDAAQMAIAMIRNKPIVGIAANQLKEEARKANNANVTGINSKVPPAERMQFIHDALPHLKKLTIVFSSDDRIFSQVDEVVAEAKKNNITVQKLMVSQLSDLYGISKSIASDSQAIFLLKDELVVSGLNTLLKTAHDQQIPIIASDDGSVQKGAAFALGVSEYQTGVDTAKVILKIMNGQSAGKLPVHMMTHYFVFLNPASAKTQNVDPEAVKKAAKKAGYVVNITR